MRLHAGLLFSGHDFRLAPGFIEMTVCSITDAAARALQSALGAAHVEFDARCLGRADPYAFSDDAAFAPAAIVRPASTAEIQAVLAIAREHRLPLWTVSTGKNLGYGGAAPRVAGSVVVDLQRMNRILEVDEELGFAVVEPGVRFLDLYAQLRAQGSRLAMSVPDIGWGSLIGNSLERGFGYAANWDHSATHCGLEIVLADGRVVRTGMGALAASEGGGRSAWHLYKGGLGPSIEGLLLQSNLGIVTRMGVWLQQRPEVVVACGVHAARTTDLGALVNTLRPLILDGTIQSNAVIGNATVVASMISERARWHSGAGAMHEASVQAMANALHLGRWNARFGLYGNEAMTTARLATVRAAVARIDGAELVARSYPGDVSAEQAHPADHSQLGIPGLALLRMADWRGGEPAHTDFSLVCPATAVDVERQRELIQRETEAAGFDYAGGFTLCGRHAIALALIAFDRSDEAMRRSVLPLMRRLINAGAAAGYAPYRSHVALMDHTAAQYNFNDGALRHTLQKIKDTLDPAGILSPGKQGVWPSEGARAADLQPAHSGASSTATATANATATATD